MIYWWVAYPTLCSADHRVPALMLCCRYVGVTLVRAVVTASRNVLWFHAAFMASKVLHGKMLWSVLRAPLGFFAATPLGRITNRFSVDVNVVDTSLPDMMNDTIMASATVRVCAVGLPPSQAPTRLSPRDSREPTRLSHHALCSLSATPSSSPSRHLLSCWSCPSSCLPCVRWSWGVGCPRDRALRGWRGPMTQCSHVPVWDGVTRVFVWRRQGRRPLPPLAA